MSTGSRREFVIPRLGRAGLGNELFPYLRSVDISQRTGRHLVAPHWFQPRVGPTLRRERDRRQYWRLFRPASTSELTLRSIVELEMGLRPAHVGDEERKSPKLLTVSGMGGYFSVFGHPGEWYADHLARLVRPGVLGLPMEEAYLSVHVRLGDFARPHSGTDEVVDNNSSTPIQWYVAKIREFSKEYPTMPVLVSSDGRDDELSEILELSNVERSKAKNALDEILLMSRSIGLIGSRSTFSAWASFLGEVPMLVIRGGNAYTPNRSVWEAGHHGDITEWLDAVDRAMRSTTRNNGR